ncbi:MAG: sugar ABC transporter permease [Anaerolineae bacterium]
MATKQAKPGPTQQTAAGRPQLRLRFRWLNDSLLSGVFLTPTMLLLLFVTVFPLIWSLYLSFTDYSVIRDANAWTTAPWVGLDNYRELLHQHELWQRFQITAAFVVPTVLLEFVLGFGIALLLNREFKGRGVITTAILIPMMLSTLVVGLFWRFMLETDFGIVDYFIRDVFGLKPVFWLTERIPARIALVIVDTWQWTPFIMLISLAGLSAVPKYLYEAADVDQASGWFKFWHITLPIVSPLLLIAVLFRLMDTYKLFDLAWVLTGGGPGDATKNVPIHLYKVAFGQFETSTASAMGYIMLVAVIALANLLIRVLNQVRSD